jgi:heme/copper-type cytochrome/quinol oxidase subunit 2
MVKEIIKRLFISLVTNPILIITYWISCYELTSICKFGRMNHNTSILLACIVFFIAVIIFITIITIKKIKNEEVEPKKSVYKVAWRYISILIIVAITSVYGVRIYKSATNYNGKLSWVIDDIKNKNSVDFDHNNIYEDGVEGIFNDIKKKYTIPNKLYISDSFKLNFNSDGTIISFETFVYGKNDKGKEDTYLIYYDKSKSEDITVELNRNVNSDYNDDKLLEPLISTVKVISIKDTVSKWKENEYGLIYYGKRDWGFNTEGIVNVDEEGNEQPTIDATSNIIGYTVSVFVPEKENEYTPVRYNLKNNSDWSKSTTGPKENNNENNSQESNNNNVEFHLSKEVGYRLDITDAAAGSRFYALSSTVDDGKTWVTINNDPFLGMSGVASEITFINNKLGFSCLSHSGGANGELYRTEDGGLSYKQIIFPVHEVKLDGGATISPFDFPGMPYEQDGTLNMLVGQGVDGDYNGNSKVLYQSKDQGVTWEFIKEVKKEQ